MPEDVALHKRNALALDGICDNNRRLVSGVVRIFQRGAQSVMIVPVKLDNVPAESTPFCTEILKLKRLFTEIETLHMVMIHDSDKVFKSVLISKQGCFPNRALVTLAVAEHGENPMVFTVLLCRQSHTGRCGKAVTQRARREIHAGQMMRYVPRQAASVGIMSFKLCGIEKTVFGKRRIDSCTRMPLAHNKAVASVPLRVFRIIVHNIRIQHGNNVRCGQNRTDMAAARQMRHFYSVPADEPGKLSTVPHYFATSFNSFISSSSKCQPMASRFESSCAGRLTPAITTDSGSVSNIQRMAQAATVFP